MFNTIRHDGEHDLDLSPDQICNRGSTTAIWDMLHGDAGHPLEQLTSHVWRGPNAGRGHVKLAWIGLGIGNEFRNRFDWNRWINHHDKRRAGDTGNWHNVSDETEIEIVIQGGVDGVDHTGQKERIAVGSRTYNGLGGDVSASARTVLDNELLTELF